MEPINPGERIAVILKTDNRKRLCYFLGYGIYEGKFIAPIDTTNKKTLKITKLGKEHCKFVMDDKSILWDYQCWFMLASRFLEVFINDFYSEGWKVINVDIKGRRRINV